MNKTHDISQLYPQWQFRIREAAENLNTNSALRTDAQIEALNARGKARSQGRDLHFVLEHIFGIPVATPGLNHNYYTVDGYWFSLKQESEPGKDEVQPVHISTCTGKKTEAAISFTLYVGKVVADPAFPDWPQRRAIVGHNMRLINTNYSRLRAELVEALDELETAYRDAIPCYQAWKDLQLLPTDAAMRQDYFLQLVRRALREMPAAELLSITVQPEPIEVLQAVLEDSKAQMDGLLLSGVERSEEITLMVLTAEADAISARLKAMSPGNYDPFDDEDEPDDLDDDEPDDDDETEPPYPDQDPAVKPMGQDLEPYFDDEDSDDDDDEVDEETVSPDLDDSTEPDTVTEAVPV